LWTEPAGLLVRLWRTRDRRLGGESNKSKSRTIGALYIFRLLLNASLQHILKILKPVRELRTGFLICLSG